MSNDYKSKLEQLKNASPLESARILKEMELYDCKSSQEIIDEVYKQFENGGNLEEEILKPVFYSVIDGLLESCSSFRAARKKGLTASRVIDECVNFSYDTPTAPIENDIDGYTEYKNINHSKIEYYANNQELKVDEYKQDYNKVTKDLKNVNKEINRKRNEVANCNDSAQINILNKEISELNKNKESIEEKINDINNNAKKLYSGHMNSEMSMVYDRSKYEDKNKMNKYKNDRVHGEKTLTDEYTGKDNLYLKKDDPNKKYNDEKHRKQAQPDHITPIKKIHDQFKMNYALDDNDIKSIANIDKNFAVTSAEINQTKLDMTNEEYIKYMRDKGTPLDSKTEQIMLQKQKESEASINHEANKVILNNLAGKAEVGGTTVKDAMKSFKELHGRAPTSDERKKIIQDLKKKKTTEIYTNTAKDAVKQSGDYIVGNLILYIVKPVYFEISDIFKNGLEEGVNASSGFEALKIRFSRVKNYVVDNFSNFCGDSILEFVKGIVSSIIEGIINLFVGMLKQVLKILKEGIKIFSQSAVILFGPDSKNMTPAQKGDAITKIIGGGIIAISGVAIESLLNKIGIGEPWSIVLSTMLSGISSAMFMYLLNKVDIFSVKAEKRRDRIIEIFDERIREINNAENDLNTIVLNNLKEQRIQFEDISHNINQSIENNDINAINENLYKMADFFKVGLEYSNTDEFCDYFDSELVLEL